MTAQSAVKQIAKNGLVMKGVKPSGAKVVNCQGLCIAQIIL